ncbi:hypothetical protein Tel_04855 [Candidatus Tenderia electrophaga]|jgi:uncharacterized membrane protein|uniref:DUF1614 domain-containing protein n=1 Tax=Candidatus Tenderia electrophaga TaxID=1748243 RepID=A0A0S2TBM2_9GAMM|nr:hypothetical protein Tel_04855 [Candidatus Tenderia electrophaga]
MPFSPFVLLALLFLLGLLLMFIQLGVLTISFAKLGLSADSALLLLLVSLMGSVINLPMFTVSAEEPPAGSVPPRLFRLLKQHMPPFEGKTTVAINAGGGLVPVSFSLYLIYYNPLPLADLLLAIAIVSAVSYFASRPVPGVGIGMPFLLAPLLAALVALLLNPQQSAPLAYICGTLGVLIGADLLRIKDIRKMGTPIAAIGGAGTFDGIFITGIIAALLA